MILERLLEVMLVECLRWRGIGEDALPPGLLAGMRDPAMRRSSRHACRCSRRLDAWPTSQDLPACRARPLRPGSPRRLGCAPMEYLARWRMALAQDALSRGGKSLDRLADEIGYESASAFSTAFRRRIGCSPGGFAARGARQHKPANHLHRFRNGQAPPTIKPMARFQPPSPPGKFHGD